MEFWLFIWILNVWLTFISIIEFETCAENVPEKKRGKKWKGNEENKKSIWMTDLNKYLMIETCADECAWEEAREDMKKKVYML